MGAAFAVAAFLAPIVIVYSPRAAVILLALLALGILAFRGWRVRSLPQPSAAVIGGGVAFVAWGFLSALWALDAVLALAAAAKLAVLAGGAVFVVSVARGLSKEERDRLGCALAGGIVLGLGAVALEWFGDGMLLRVLRTMHPDTSIRGYWFDQPSSALALLTWPALLWLWQKRWRWAAVVIALAAVFMLKQLQNVTASYGLLASLLVFAVVRAWPRKAAVAFTVVLVAGTLSAPLIASGLQAIDDLEVGSSRFAPLYGSLSSRLAIWGFAIERIAERPLLGWGMDGSRIIPGGTQHLPGTDIDRMPLHPHNVALQWWLELGLVGALLAAILAGGIVLAATRAVPDRNVTAASLAALVLATAIWSMSYGAWQSWWIATLGLCAAFMGGVMPSPEPVAAHRPSAAPARRGAGYLAGSRTRAVVLALTLIVVGVGVAEAAFRWLPSKYSQWFEHQESDRTTVSYRDVGGGLFTLAPAAAARKETPCTDIAPIRVNAQGFRDSPWSLEKRGFRIAVLGDGLAEALEVGEGEHLSAILSDLLGAQVMNAGITGYSTVTELAAYRRMIAPYRPDLVLLLAFPANDLAENSCALDPTRHLCGIVGGSPIAYRGADGAGGIEAVLRRHLALYRPLTDLKTVLHAMWRQVSGYVPERWRLYLADELPPWRDAWTFTEDALARLNAAVAADGARLAVAIIPDGFVTSVDWERDLIWSEPTAVPDGFDPQHPARRLASIARGQGLPVVDLTQVLVSYRDSVNLRPPYFSYACGGGWNPVAHYVAAHAIADFLASENLLASGMIDRMGAYESLKAVLKRSPREILGGSSYRQIYAGGRYSGGAALDTVEPLGRRPEASR